MPIVHRVGKRKRTMKIPTIFVNRETVQIYLAFCSAFKRLYTGFKDLLICVILAMILIPLTILDLLSRNFKRR